MENNLRQQNPFDVHPLDELLDIERHAVIEFAKNHPDFWGYTQNASSAARMLISIAAKVHHTEPEAYRLILWQTVLRYQIHALQSIIIGELGIAYTLIRNATELSRDIICIKTDNDVERWFKSKTERKRDNFFKFNESDPVQAYVHSVYKEASDLGTHGHFSLMKFGEIADHLEHDGKEIAMVQVSDKGMGRALHLWLASFTPIQMLCGSIFREEHPEDFTVGWELLLKWNNAVYRFLEEQRSKTKIFSG